MVHRAHPCGDILLPEQVNNTVGGHLTYFLETLRSWMAAEYFSLNWSRTNA
jgi:hypothetical protein